jgi:general secretion pathway protein H
MNGSSRTAHITNGFTLIELLVVTVIIGISAGLFVINLSLKGPEDTLNEEINRIRTLLLFAHEQSIIRNEEYGLRFNEQGFRFFILDEEADPAEWNLIQTDKLLRERTLPENIVLSLAVDGIDIEIPEEPEKIPERKKQDEDEDEDKDKKNTNTIEDEEDKIEPQVFLMSSSEITPDFVVSLRIPSHDLLKEVHASVDGKVEIVKNDE